MAEVVYRVAEVVSTLVSQLPIGTNQGLADLLWMVLRGELLASRGAILPGLAQVGWPEGRVRRAWAALGAGAWTSGRLLKHLAGVVRREGHWQPTVVAGWRIAAADVTGFWRPQLRHCPTTHDSTAAGKALPAIPIGIVARVGRAGPQRVALPVALVRADLATPSPVAHNRRLLEAAAAQLAPDELLVVDRGFPVGQVQAAGVDRDVVRLPKNFTARRREPIPYCGHGKHPTRGELVRPLARTVRGRVLAATPPDAMTTWTDGADTIRGEQWRDLVVQAGTCASPPFTVTVLHHPRQPEPLVLACPLPLTPAEAGAAYRERWPVEQIPLAAKPILGAGRHFVWAPETCQRWAEFTLLAGALINYLAATSPPVPTGFWDRDPPRPTPGRLRRLLARCPLPDPAPGPSRLRLKASVTSHLPTGFGHQRHRHRRPTSGATDLAPPAPLLS